MQSQVSNSGAAQESYVIKLLQNLLKERGDEVHAWLRKTAHNTPPFFYNSVDLRHSGFKLAPVDTNLFPAGFNNLNGYERGRAVGIVQNFFATYYPNVKKILLIPEDHTRNTYYLENIGVLSEILQNAGMELRLSSLGTYESGVQANFTSPSGMKIVFTPIEREGTVISTKDGFVPDFILLNNDMTAGAPELFNGVTQIVSPAPALGWHLRRKTSHFEAYNDMARNFANEFGLDKWLISTYFERCGVVNFKEKQGLECVAIHVDKLLWKIKQKYTEYDIKEQPYVFIKSDMGTYGMGIMTARSGDEVLAMGKDIRKKMNIIKGGTQNTEVIIQEGVPTIDKVEENSAEPMIYLIGGEPVGCIYRSNTRQNSYENLNASGMGFSSIGDHTKDTEVCSSLGVIAKLAACAAVWECYVESYSI